MRNLKLRNFGLGNRCMRRALLNAYKETIHSFSSEATAKSAINRFIDYIEQDINHPKDLQQITAKHTKEYAMYLLHLCESDTLSSKTAKCYIATLNKCFENARYDSACNVQTKELNFPSETSIAKKSKAASKSLHEHVKSVVSPLLSCKIELQRHFGLRFKESCLIDCKYALEQAMNNNYIDVTFGTKGGRERSIPITTFKQLEVLEAAANAQGNMTSLIPAHMSWATCQDQSYREVSNIEGYNFHAERHHYAQSRYKCIVGLDCPVKLGLSRNDQLELLAQFMETTVELAKEADNIARKQIAEELGHSRISITRTYLG